MFNLFSLFAGFGGSRGHPRHNLRGKGLSRLKNLKSALISLATFLSQGNEKDTSLGSNGGRGRRSGVRY
eukprot:4791496-Amphidinium_carterae.1